MSEIHTVLGIPILTNKIMPVSTPKMKLRDNIRVSDSFRSEFNSWLKQRFGEEPIFYKINIGDMYGRVESDTLAMFGAQTEAIVTHPANLKCIRTALEKINAVTHRNS